MRVLSVLCALTVAALLGACGDDAGGGQAPVDEEGTLEVENAFVPVSPAPELGAVYFTIVNGTDTDDAVVDVSSDAAATVELHLSSVDDEGRAIMTHQDRVAVPAGETVAFEAGGLHVMLTGVEPALEAGTTIEVDLEFEQAGTVTVVAEVVPFAADQHDDDAMHHDHEDDRDPMDHDHD